MPAVPLTFRPVCGGFFFIFNGFMAQRVKEKVALYQRTLKLVTVRDGVVVGLILALFYHGTLLQRCGDVELNPGPGSKDNMRQTRLRCDSAAGSSSAESDSVQTAKSQSDVSGAGSNPTLHDVMSLLSTMNSKFDHMQEELTDVKEKVSTLNDDIKGIKDEISELKQKNDDLTKRNEEQTEKIDQMERKIDDLESRSKRSNLIFYGVARDKNESSESCEAKVQSLLKEKMGLAEVQFDRVHRVNMRDNAPIVARCTFYRQKLDVIKNKRKLQGTNVFIGEDFSQRVRDVRKKLSPHLKTARSQKKKATMIFDHLLIEGKKYGLDEKERLVEIK